MAPLTIETRMTMMSKMFQMLRKYEKLNRKFNPNSVYDLKCLEPVVSDLNDLLDDVIENEHDIDDFTGQDKVIIWIDISQQFWSVETH